MIDKSRFLEMARFLLMNERGSLPSIGLAGSVSRGRGPYRGGALLDLQQASPPAERSGSLDTLPGSSERDRQSCLHEIIEAWAARTPDAGAVLFGGEALSYRALNQRANRLAALLRARGVGVGSLVGVSMKRSHEMIIGLLAILKAGAAYVPLDPRLPRERLLFLVADGPLPIILTRGGHLEVGDAQIIDMTQDATGGADGTDCPDIASGVEGGDLVYVIYTSGSTGEPKGVMVPHRGVVNWLVWMRNTFQVTPADVVLKKAPLTFDVSAWELFLPLISGACLVLADSDRQFDPAYLADLMASTRVTVAQFVPSLLRSFLEQGELPDLSALRHVMCGGEAFSPKLQAQFFQRLTSEVCNSYGPTEASIGVTRWPCRPDDTRESVSIGYAIDNTELYILDADLNPVPPGAPGELYIGGRCLGRGYLNRPDLTAERFVPNPFNAGDEARMYRTGDLCRFLDDGSIDFLGRIDDQVKVRGVRIELPEVEKFICLHEAVEAAAATVDTSADDAVLVAFVVPAPGKAVTDRELRAFLRQKLPLSMVPAEFYFVQTLPVSANGKLDRKKLQVQRQPPPVVVAPPRDDLEARLRAIWRDLLGRDDFGPDDDFFDCGGDSLLTAQLFGRVEAEFGADISLDSVLGVLTIESLADLLRGTAEADDAPGAGRAAEAGVRIDGVLCRLATQDDLEGIWRVCARAFLPYADASFADFRELSDHRWLNNPCRTEDDPLGWVLETETGQIVGFHGIVPTRVWVGGQRVPAIAPTTWAADPGYGRQGLVLLSTYLNWGRDRFLLNTTANAITSAMHESSHSGMRRIPLEGFDQRLLWVHDFKPLVRWKVGQRDAQGRSGSLAGGLAGRAIASRIGAALAGTGAAFALGVPGGFAAAMRASIGRSRIDFACRELPIEKVDRFGQEFDELRERLRHNYAVTTERSSVVLNWRHINPPRLVGRSYALACRDGGRLEGYVALREPTTTAPGHMIVTDLFYDPARPDVMRNLLNAAFRFAVAQGASVLEIFGFHPSLNQELQTQRPYQLQRLQLEQFGRQSSFRTLAGILRRRGGDTPSATYWYRAPTPELAQVCASGAWWPSGIDGDLNL
jgi:amino acid adenylation domain-containing protein